MATISYWCWCNHLGDNPPLMISMHQLTNLGNFGTFSNFSLFFTPWNIIIMTFLFSSSTSLPVIAIITWLMDFTKSKDFKWFRRSPLLHSSWNVNNHHHQRPCHNKMASLSPSTSPVQGRMEISQYTPQAFWPGWDGSGSSSPCYCYSYCYFIRFGWFRLFITLLFRNSILDKVNVGNE